MNPRIQYGWMQPCKERGRKGGGKKEREKARRINGGIQKEKKVWNGNPASCVCPQKKGRTTLTKESARGSRGRIARGMRMIIKRYRESARESNNSRHGSR